MYNTFEEYVDLREQMETHRHHRLKAGLSAGILMDDDEHALKYQKASRDAYALAEELYAHLQQVEDLGGIYKFEKLIALEKEGG